MQLGWIDFSKSDRSIAHSVLKLLEEPGAVDEMGIGIIRDAFADILFPGTSTIQTRAKYLFIVPYICMELERQTKLSPRDFIESLYKNEIDLIKPLAERSGRRIGVIGEDAGDRLQRKPSSIYWSALRLYEFFREASFTLPEYASAFCRLRDSGAAGKSLGRVKYGEEDNADDADANMSGAAFWSVPYPDENWRDSIDIELTRPEAGFLRSKIIKAEKTKNTLMALLIKEDRCDYIAFERFDDLDDLTAIMPPQIRTDYILARDFSRFVYGAQIRYNVIFSKGENAYANDEWEAWYKNGYTVNLDDVFLRLKTRNPGTITFLRQYQKAIGNTDALDKLIKEREMRIKGAARAKLTNTELYAYEGQTINLIPLSYRFYNAQRLIRDIFEGVDRNA